MSKASDERYTPVHILDVVHEFDFISCDPCTTMSNPARAPLFYTGSAPDDDGLSSPWSTSGLNWVNYPYSRGQPDQWIGRMIHWGAELGCEVISLGPADTSTLAVRRLLRNANAIAFWHKRIAFLRPDGAYEAGGKFASMSAYFGERAGRFKRVFSKHCEVLVLR